jgi:hypothetical protein
MISLICDLDPVDVARQFFENGAERYLTHSSPQYGTLFAKSFVDRLAGSEMIAELTRGLLLAGVK